MSGLVDLTLARSSWGRSNDISDAPTAESRSESCLCPCSERLLFLAWRGVVLVVQVLDT
jgi:hypothetical protein